MVSRLDANWRDSNVRNGIKKLTTGFENAPKANQLASFLHSLGQTSSQAKKSRALLRRHHFGAFLRRRNIHVQPTAVIRRRRVSRVTNKERPLMDKIGTRSNRIKRRRSLLRNIANNVANAQKH